MKKHSEHTHSHSHIHHHHGDVKNIKIAFFLNLGFSVIEIVGGILTNSVAILSDAVHDLGDSLSLGMSWYFQETLSEKRDEVYTYGYKRFSIVGALVNSIVLIVGSVLILGSYSTFIQSTTCRCTRDVLAGCFEELLSMDLPLI